MADRTPLDPETGSDSVHGAAKPDAADEAPGGRKSPPPLSRYAREGALRDREPRGGPGSRPPVLRVEAMRSEPHPGEARSSELVPVPARPGPQPPPAKERRPFWKRIGLSRPAAAAAPPPDTGLLMARLAELEKQLTSSHAATLSRLDGFEENITRLWELEEQLSLAEVRERLALIEATQEEIADGLHAVSRNVSILAVVLALAVAAGLLGLGIVL